MFGCEVLLVFDGKQFAREQRYIKQKQNQHHQTIVVIMIIGLQEKDSVFNRFHSIKRNKSTEFPESAHIAFDRFGERRCIRGVFNPTRD